MNYLDFDTNLDINSKELQLTILPTYEAASKYRSDYLHDVIKEHYNGEMNGHQLLVEASLCAIFVLPYINMFTLHKCEEIMRQRLVVGHSIIMEIVAGASESPVLDIPDIMAIRTHDDNKDVFNEYDIFEIQ